MQDCVVQKSGKFAVYIKCSKKGSLVLFLVQVRRILICLLRTSSRGWLRRMFKTYKTDPEAKRILGVAS